MITFHRISGADAEATVQWLYKEVNKNGQPT
jgi:hypothetical protein